MVKKYDMKPPSQDARDTQRMILFHMTTASPGVKSVKRCIHTALSVLKTQHIQTKGIHFR